MIAQRPATALALWLAKNEPAIFAELEKTAAAQHAQLHGWSDVLSSIGNTITEAASNVGSYLASSDGLKTLTGLATSYLATKQQANVLSTQVALAQAGQQPAAITNTIGANGQVIPVYTPTNQVATNQILAGLQPTFIQRYKVPILIGGVGLVALLVLSR